MIRLIGLCGSIGSGKDTVAAALAPEYERLAFADELKKWVAAGYPWVPKEHFFGSQEQKSATLWVVSGSTHSITVTGRHLLEVLGQTARNMYPDVWVKPVMELVDAMPARRFVIADVRHPNEFEAIWERGGEVWEVVKVGGEEAERTGHISDDAWRTMRKDATLIARAGDLDALKTLARRMADAPEEPYKYVRKGLWK